MHMWTPTATRASATADDYRVGVGPAFAPPCRPPAPNGSELIADLLAGLPRATSADARGIAGLPA